MWRCLIFRHEKTTLAPVQVDLGCYVISGFMVDTKGYAEVC